MKFFIKNIAFPLHEFFKKHKSISNLQMLEQSQWYSRDKLYRLQSERLMEFINHVYMNVPYYKNLFDFLKLRPDSFEKHEDLNKLPFLTKGLIRENLDMLKSEKAKGLLKSNTGGSTGSPLIFYLGKKRISADVASKSRATRWWGVDIGDPEIVIWGSPVELTRQDKIRNLRDWLFRTKLLSAFNMSDETMLRYLNIIKSYRPKHVFGYPSSIFLLCRYARQKNIRLDNLGTKVVFCTAEKLYDHQREMISETFSAPVANGYGGRDSGFIAHECPRGGMHIAAENIVVEIIDHEGNSQPSGCRGEIVITHLDSHDFPFIRYKTGDIGSLSEDVCPCGRGLPLLKDIEGRTTDFIITSDKKIMHGLSLIYILREIHGIEQFRIVQEEVDLFSVSIVKNSSFGSESEEVIRKGFKDRIGSDVKIRFNYQQKIEPEKSGKFRYVVSKVPQPYSV